jgi:hypothetical protein
VCQRLGAPYLSTGAGGGGSGGGGRDGGVGGGAGGDGEGGNQAVIAPVIGRVPAGSEELRLVMEVRR